VKRVILAIIMMVSMVTVAQAWQIRTDVGVNTIIARQSVQVNGVSLQDTSGISNTFAIPEFFITAMTPNISLRGYITPQRDFTGQGTWMVPVEKDKPKAIPISSSYGFNTGRVELGFPFTSGNFVIEPSVSLVRNAYYSSVVGDKLQLNNGSSATYAGIGVSANALLTKHEVLSFHGNWSTHGSLYDIWILRSTGNLFAGAGYTNRKFNDDVMAVSFKGGAIILGVMF
jgi:hypothetical protein